MSDSRTEVTGWVGWGVFASIVLLVAGLFDLVYGLAAVIGPNSAYFLTTEGQLFLFDIAGWGWWHIIAGAAMIVVSLFLFRGATWARVVAIILVAFNGLSQLALLPVQPWWSIIVLALDILVLYALTVHGRELKVAHGG
ncbi:hypothetical protein ACDF64_02050 [Agromyces sp. MMS24-JH15]|uniref:DUF7144 family membrane protein n=1 Tax=Agromyces sp. MMS24-JH15 TaxID=3243765 RepID=UPI00374A6D87